MIRHSGLLKKKRITRWSVVMWNYTNDIFVLFCGWPIVFLGISVFAKGEHFLNPSLFMPRWCCDFLGSMGNKDIDNGIR